MRSHGVHQGSATILNGNFGLFDCSHIRDGFQTVLTPANPILLLLLLPLLLLLLLCVWRAFLVVVGTRF